MKKETKTGGGGERKNKSLEQQKKPHMVGESPHEPVFPGETGQGQIRGKPTNENKVVSRKAHVHAGEGQLRRARLGDGRRHIAGRDQAPTNAEGPGRASPAASGPHCGQGRTVSGHATPAGASPSPPAAAARPARKSPRPSEPRRPHRLLLFHGGSARHRSTATAPRGSAARLETAATAIAFRAAAGLGDTAWHWRFKGHCVHH